MVRLGAVALLLLSLRVAAWSAPPATAENLNQNQTFQLPRPGEHQRFARSESIGRKQINPNAHVGFGMFGLKSEKAHSGPVIVGEINAPKQRRAGVGFSLEF